MTFFCISTITINGRRVIIKKKSIREKNPFSFRFNNSNLRIHFTDKSCYSVWSLFFKCVVVEFIKYQNFNYVSRVEDRFKYMYTVLLPQNERIARVIGSVPTYKSHVKHIRAETVPWSTCIIKYVKCCFCMTIRTAYKTISFRYG